MTKRKWVDELPGVLWAYRKTNMKPIGVSPFALTYDMEAIIPTEIRVLTLQKEIHEKVNIEANAKDLNMADELREVAIVHIVS